MQITKMDEFLAYLEKVRERTMRVVLCIPTDRVEWKYAPGKFTLGDLARHIAATERFLFVECACGGQNRYHGCGREVAEGCDSVITYMEKLHRESVAMLEVLCYDDLQRRCDSADGTPITTWKLLRAMVEHEIHHRGELYAALGMLGIELPPLYGLTSEQLQVLGNRD